MVCMWIDILYVDQHMSINMKILYVDLLLCPTDEGIFRKFSDCRITYVRNILMQTSLYKIIKYVLQNFGSYGVKI